MKDEEQKTASENISRIDQLQGKITAYEKARKEIEQDADTTIRTLYKWTAPERIYTPKPKRFFVIVAAVFVVGIVIAAILESIMFILVLVALLALIYINHSIPPGEGEYEITNKGLKAYNKVYLWKVMQNFWITKRGENLILNIDIKEKIEDRIILLIGKGDPKRIIQELLKYINYLEKTGENFLTKYADGEYVPLIQFMDVDGSHRTAETKTAKS